MRVQSINPATGQVLRTFPSLSEDELRQKITGAAEAAAQQRSAPLEHRLLHLRKLSALLLEQSEELAHSIALETGKPKREARNEVAACAAVCRYYAEHATRLLAPELLPAETGQAHVQYNPMGVVLAVMPWNSPLWNGFRLAVPALVAGNTVLMKHASSVPQCSLHMAALVRQAGFLPGSLTALLMDDSLVETALNDSRVAAISVTGSTAAGRALAAQAGWLLKKSTLHLEGSDPFLVMPSADLDVAVQACSKAIVLGTAAAKRVIVHEDVYAAFASRLVAALERMRIGDPLLDETDLGPLGTPAAVQAMNEQVSAGVAEGGRIQTGGSPMVGAGSFFEPTLLSDVPAGSTLAQSAPTGPFALLFRAESVQDAVRLANGTPFAGAASLWTQVPQEQQRLSAEVDAGFIALNAAPVGYPLLPTGGSGRSGYGRQLGTAGFREFVQAKTVWVA